VRDVLKIFTDSSTRFCGQPIGFSHGCLKGKSTIGGQEPTEGSIDCLSPKKIRVVYGRRGMEQVCSLRNIIGGRLWSIGEVAKVMFEFGEGFTIDFDGWPMQFDRTSIVYGS